MKYKEKAECLAVAKLLSLIRLYRAMHKYSPLCFKLELQSTQSRFFSVRCAQHVLFMTQISLIVLSGISII